MSGGSYNYLFSKTGENIDEARQDMSEMLDRLVELGYLEAAKETQDAISILDLFKLKIQEKIDRLSKVWKAVEWYDSNDWEEDEIEKAIEEYRKRKEELK